MKPARSAIIRGLALLASAGLFALVPGRAADATDDQGQPRNYTVFLGLDVSVHEPAAEGRVESFSRGHLHVATATGTRSLNLASVKNVGTIRDPKVAPSRVTIASVDAERTYAPGTDPGRKAVEQQSQMLAYESELKERSRRYDRGLAEAQKGSSPASGPGAGFAAAERQAIINSNQSNVDAVRHEMTVGNYDPLLLGDKMRSDGSGAYDTFEVTFEVFSPVEIRDAYAVLVTVVLAPDAPKTPMNVFAFQELPPLTEKPRKIRMTHGGLPAGFGFGDYEIHLYADGRELATNLSRNRVDVSRSEAHQFLVLRRSLTAGKVTRPAEVTRELLPAENRARIPADQLSRSVGVHVSREGIVENVTLGPGDTSESDGAIATLLRATCFFPALVHGEPTESQTTVSLAELVR